MTLIREFSRAKAESSLEKLAMTPPLPEAGQDAAWMDEGEKNTNDKYRGGIAARLVGSEDEFREHFGA